MTRFGERKKTGVSGNSLLPYKFLRIYKANGNSRSPLKKKTYNGLPILVAFDTGKNKTSKIGFQLESLQPFALVAIHEGRIFLYFFTHTTLYLSMITIRSAYYALMYEFEDILKRSLKRQHLSKRQKLLILVLNFSTWVTKPLCKLNKISIDISYMSIVAFLNLQVILQTSQ